MKLYNTLSRSVEPFEPGGDSVKIYVCGITPYDTTHVGHAFTYASVDALVRYLELRGMSVQYVQNVTDIDDDILRRARAVGEDWKQLGNQWTTHYVRDMQALNIRPPDHFPRATDVIDDIIDQVRKLLKRGVAYQANGNVYYSVSSWPEFGKLSQIPRSEMLPIANERGNYPNDPHKRDPLDFVLWQAEMPGEPSWESPWGKGRPGWHIECSTLAQKYLGDRVDIHGGGADLCFPHHECEIAQVEPLRERRPFVRVWMHTAMVEYKGEKMSKSLGNLVMISDLLPKYTANAVRVYLASHHYRKPWSFDEGDLKKAARLAEKFEKAVSAPAGTGTPLESEAAWAAFTASMDNDLDTPGALKVMEGLAEAIEDASMARRNVVEAQSALKTFGSVFGLRLGSPGGDEPVPDGWNALLPRFA